MGCKFRPNGVTFSLRAVCVSVSAVRWFRMNGAFRHWV